jgi:hypothetical protein
MESLASFITQSLQMNCVMDKESFAEADRRTQFITPTLVGAFPDALLRRRNVKGTWNSCRAEFEFKSSSFKLHKHEPQAVRPYHLLGA